MGKPGAGESTGDHGQDAQKSEFQGDAARDFVRTSNCLVSKQSVCEPFRESSRLNHGALSRNDRKFFGPSGVRSSSRRAATTITDRVCALFDNILQEQVLGGRHA
jgi:hypothetical protein